MTKVIFVNPPNATNLHVAEPGKYVDENVGNQFLILPRIPFYVMASLPKSIEKDIILLDYEWYKHPELSKEELAAKVFEKKPDIVATTLIAQANADSIDWLTTEIKKHFPKVPIIVGGQGVKCLEERVFTYCPNIDIACITGSDDTFASFSGDLERLTVLPGIIYRKDDRLVKNPCTKLFEKSFLPQEIYGQFEPLIREIVAEVSKRKGFVLGMLENNKGCPFSCEFCAAKGPVLRKDSEKTLEELGY
ncbi:MAG: cobalamin-dependent protein, partial [Atribacterota bacterium]|nr:cobalamin-dependent protein [Atribacterota bacterium]